ncbi:AhpC/TSA family protein [Pedobacter hiemivivus]|uniref:AhpC/TSA family protein n=1 Tax=Pedobacter hiemivivus TaxID=2530454 RepID=A0A4U1GFG5_9SPHI|nr:TlpA disulfide reductase family protein [Pedobacter hiemivivus]TKC60042.1 AhpC/TSA family protein [Pedobacter hiemivivus]
MIKKLKFIMSLLLCASIGAYAQTAIVLGNISGLKESKIVFYYFKDGKSVTDTVKVKDGQFRWVVKMPEAQKVSVVLLDDYYQFFVESGNIKITGGKTIEELKVTGSKTQDEYKAHDQTLLGLNNQRSSLYDKWGKVSDEEQAVLEAKIEDLGKQRKQRNNQYIIEHPKSAVSLSLVSDKVIVGNYEDAIYAYEKLAPSAQISMIGKQIAERLTVLKRSAIGATMLSFTQNDPEGKPVQFANFKGKYVLVDFWASWCGPCRAENPNVLKVYNQYKDKNFTVVGISLDDKADRWKKAIKDDKMPWTQVSDLKGWKNEIATYFGIKGIPNTLLIDPKGNIIAVGLRGETLVKALGKYLGGV